MRKLVAACLAPFLFLPAAASIRTASDRRVALDRFRAGASGRIEVRWTPDHTRVRMIAGRLSPARTAPPEEIARTFLAENGDLFGLRADLSDLRLRDSRSSPGGHHLSFDQDHDGLPVFESGLDVHVAADGSVNLVQSDYAAPIVAPAAPLLSAPQAAAAALEHFRRAYRPAPDRRGRSAPAPGPLFHRPESTAPQLGILPTATGQRLVYRIEVFAPSPAGAAEYHVSAQDGSIVEWRDLARTVRDGQGIVFDPNPVAFLGDPSLRDLDDAADASFTGAYQGVALPDLRRLLLDLIGPYFLGGPYAIVNDLLEQPLNPLVVSPDGRFEFTRDRQGFESVMVYYHVDRNQRYIQSLGFTDVNNRAIRVDPHGLNGADNSHYIGFPIGWGFMAFGEGGVDDAEDADVILHEYGHAVQDNQTFGRYLRGGEAGAQGEGFGDYWAFSGGPAGGFDPPCIGEWDLEGTCLRRVDGLKRYPDDLVGEVHADGEIWSSVLHAAHHALGKEAADQIAIESHFLVPRVPDFCDGAGALRQAAAILYDEAARHAAGSAAAGRGIAGDLGVRNLAVLPDASGGRRLLFEIANQGPCPIGPARHAIHLVGQGSGFDAEIATVETQDLAPDESASFDLVVPGLAEPWLYRIFLDADDQEPETDEANNSVDSPPQSPAVFGAPPTIESVAVFAGTGTAVCDLTEILEGHLCSNDFPAGLFAAPFPVVTLTAHYTEVSLSASVIDPDSTPSQSDILIVTASFLRLADDGQVEEVSLVLLDDGSANVFSFSQEGVIPESCDVDPEAGVCTCVPANYGVTSQDPAAGDTDFTRVLPLVARGPDIPAGVNAAALMRNCIARDRLQPPFAADALLDRPPEFKIEAVDRSGHFTAWPVLPPVSVQPGSVSCDGDLCGCCLLMSPDIVADPAEGGCRGLPGLTGVPGSGFENGFCVDLIP